MSLRDTIRGVVDGHLNAGYLVMGQCLTAVGWVGNTLPKRFDMTELPCSDVAGAGFVVGAALMGRRPIYVIRYQGFNWFNAPIIVNYACKSLELWNRPCPLLIRSIAMEGGVGPVAGSSHHSLYYRMPGVSIYSPMTPLEFTIAYQEFMNQDGVVYLSEHRGAYDNEEELHDILHDRPDIVLFPISITRFAAMEAAIALHKKGVNVAVHHVFHVKPFMPSEQALEALRKSRYGGIVLDDDYTNGIAKSLAHDLSDATGAQMDVMGLEDRTSGFSNDNLPPSEEQIINKVLHIAGPRLRTVWGKRG